jgi:hypothetical protein
MILPALFPPSILLINARSLWNKLDELRVLAANSKPDCIAVTETWFTSDQPDGILLLKNYSLFRADRCSRTGGGVCLYVHDSLQLEIPTQLNVRGSEALTLCFPKRRVTLLCLYIPPNLPSSQHRDIQEEIDQHVDKLLVDSPGMRVIICGDFNDFDTSSFRQNFNCINKVTSPTRGKSFLDQIWVTEELADDYSKAAEVGPPLGTSDHCCVMLHPCRDFKKIGTTEHTVFDYRASNINSFLLSLAKSDFRDVFTASGVNEKCEAFYKTFLLAHREIPRTRVIITSHDKPWITPLLKKMIQDRWVAFRTKNWSVFEHLKAKTRREVMRAKQSWCDRVMRRDKHIWNIVNDLQGRKSQYRPPNDNRELSQLVAALSERFQTNLNAKSDAEECHLDDQSWCVRIDSGSVWHALRHLRQKQSPGLDEIPARLLRLSAAIICEPLAAIFKSSVENREFPECWKKGIIRPIPKIQKPSKDDFRPITLLPILSKVFERLILSAMKKDFINEFGPNQHAFRPFGSSTSALIHIYDCVTSYMDKNDTLATRMLCLDFSKAFDKLQHQRLINLLRHRGFNHGFLAWLRSFLLGRHSRVKIKDCSGPLIYATSGIPQGSVLGPYLFAMFISSLKVDSEDATLVKFADDLTMIERLSAIGSQHNNLSRITAWSEENNMPLNIKKCHQLLFRRSKSDIPGAFENLSITNEAIVLGVVITNDMKWKKHFDRVLLSANRRLHTLRLLKPLVPKEKLMEVFNSSVLSVVSYASPLFPILPTSIVDRVEKLVKRAHRIICGLDCKCSLMPDTEKTRKRATLDLLSKCENPDHPLHLLVPPRLPNSRMFRLPQCMTSRRLNSFFPQACILANSQQGVL